MWSFVGSKNNKQWVWLAIDADSREIVGVFVGERSRQSAKQLWQSLPAVYRQCAVCYTDFWQAYQQVLPSKRHRAVGKETGKTSYIERFNNTLLYSSGTFGKENLVLLQEIEQSHRSNLVLCASLQRFSSFLAITIQHYQFHRMTEHDFLMSYPLKSFGV